MRELLQKIKFLISISARNVSIMNMWYLQNGFHWWTEEEADDWTEEKSFSIGRCWREIAPDANLNRLDIIYQLMVIWNRHIWKEMVRNLRLLFASQIEKMMR